MSWPPPPVLLAIDPQDCGCLECLTGEYVPLQAASSDQVLLLLQAKIADNSDSHWSWYPQGELLQVRASGAPGHSWWVPREAEATFDMRGSLARYESAYAMSIARGH